MQCEESVTILEFIVITFVSGIAVWAIPLLFMITVKYCEKKGWIE